MTDEFKIGIWGTARAGKTTYLAMLYHAFLSKHTEWTISADPAAREFVENARDLIFNGGIFPEKTVETRFYRYVITHKDRPNQPIELEFLDAAGELFEYYYDRERRADKPTIPQSSTEERMTNSSPAEIFNYLKSCHGVLVFLDPARGSEGEKQRPYAQLLFQLFEDLRDHFPEKRLRSGPYLAFCMTKSDGEKSLWEQRDIDNERCYRATGDTAYCEESCPIYHRLLAPPFMEKELPGMVDPDIIHCYALSAIGRQSNETTNVSRGSDWQREITPFPPVFDVSLPGMLAYMYDEIIRDPDQQDANFMPSSILIPKAIQQHNLLSPILWMLEKASRQ